VRWARVARLGNRAGAVTHWHRREHAGRRGRASSSISSAYRRSAWVKQPVPRQYGSPRSQPGVEDLLRSVNVPCVASAALERRAGLSGRSAEPATV